MDDIDLILSLSNAFGPSGCEDEVVEILKGYLSDKMNYKENHMRDLFLEFKNFKSNHLTVSLDAHLDEVGLMVQAIKPNGMIEFLSLGSFQSSTLPGTNILIKNDDGKYIEGIVSSIPPHYLTAEDKNKPLSISNMTIDVGASSADEVRDSFHINVGNFACPSVKAKYNKEKDLFFGKAFDCRIGVAAMAKVLKDIDTKKLNVNLKACFTSQEEVGERGSFSASKEINPDVTIVFEGCPADDSFQKDYKIQTAIKKGPMIRHMDVSIIANPRLQSFVKKVARKHNLPLQEGVRSGGGNNGAVYQNNNSASVVMGVPVRYIHTPNCITTYKDFLNTVKLVTEILYELNDEIVKGF